MDPVKTNEELILLCRRGDERAWERLILRHQDRILNLAYQFLGNRDEARDLAQEIFVRLYQKVDQYDAQRPFQTWFNRLARNACIDRYRQRKRDRVLVSTPVDEMSHLPAKSAPSDRHLELRERTEIIHRALGTLGEISREAIVLKDLQEHSIEEISGMLELPIGTVKSRIHRARIELARAIQKLQCLGVQPEGSNGM